MERTAKTHTDPRETIDVPKGKTNETDSVGAWRSRTSIARGIPAYATAVLNKKMKEIRDGGKVVGNERIAIMAALNIAHEHLQLQVGRPHKSADISVDEDYVRRKMELFEGIIEKAVSDQEKLF